MTKSPAWAALMLSGAFVAPAAAQDTAPDNLQTLQGMQRTKDSAFTFIEQQGESVQAL